MPILDIIIYLLLFIGALLSYTGKKLTLPGAITGAFIGLLIYKGAGLEGITLLALFFIAGSWATGWKRNQKIDVAESDGAPRTAAQVLANGGVAALLGTIAWIMPDSAPLLQLMIAGSFASATADTLSSELGMIYGKRFFNIVTFKKDNCGLDGVVSIEGTLIGVAGAVAITITYCLYNGWSTAIPIIVLAGFTGNVVDSVLGATLERKHLIGNNTVNFLNTLTGALMCYILL